MQGSEARERVLAAAEKLFVERGYAAVTVKDIAKGAGIHHASIYHHAPGGKEALFSEVMTRHFERHREGLEGAMQAGGDDLREQLRAIAEWLLSQPPIDLVRMANADMPAISPEAAEHLSTLSFETVLVPLEQLLKQAQQRGEIAAVNAGNMAGAILASIQGLHALPDRYLATPRQAMADEIIDVFIAGMQHTHP